jgi:serine O-acetyltransferase
MTVVGIPARIVRDTPKRRNSGGRIDLDHHLISDPVGEALSILIDRVAFLEARVNHLQMRARKTGPADQDLALDCDETTERRAP